MKAYTHQQLWDLIEQWRHFIDHETLVCAQQLEDVIGERDMATNA
jgi:hypothetical protein